MAASINVRVSPDVKKQAQDIFAQLGMDLTTAVNIFLRQVILTNGLPFEVKLNMPNQETLEAMEEVRSMKQNPENYSGYADANAMFRDILS